MRIKKTNGADFRAGVSADQIMAQRIGLLTPFRSLELSCDTVLNVGTCDTDYACVYQHNLAWSSPTTPLTPETRHIVNARSIAMAKPGVMLVNTSRGALVDLDAVIDGLKSGQLGYLAIDVYEQEADLFFEDLSNEIIQDDAFQRLLTFPNVLVTGHQAFFTREALTAIADTTLANITAFERGEPLVNAVGAELVTPSG